MVGEDQKRKRKQNKKGRVNTPPNTAAKKSASRNTEEKEEKEASLASPAATEEEKHQHHHVYESHNATGYLQCDIKQGKEKVCSAYSISFLFVVSFSIFPLHAECAAFSVLLGRELTIATRTV